MTAAELRDLHDRRSRAMLRRPSFAAGSGHAQVRHLDGLRYEVVHDGRSLVVDLPPEDGGSGSAAYPGQLLRASVGACLAMGYQLWSARLDIPIDRVDVELYCEYDARGQLGLSEEVPVGWRRIDVSVTVYSAAPASEIQRLIAHANRLSPMLANLSRDIQQVHHLTVVAPPAR